MVKVCIWHSALMQFQLCKSMLLHFVALNILQGEIGEPGTTGKDGSTGVLVCTENLSFHFARLIT